MSFFFLSRDDGSLLVREQEAEILQVDDLIVNGKNFGMYIRYVLISSSNDLKLSTAAELAFYFLDDDGDGRFETRLIGPDLNQIPKWAVKGRSPSK